MATTFVDYTGDGNATKSFSFPSYKVEDIKVDVDGVIKSSGTHYNITSYTTTGGGNVVFTSGNIPASPAAIRIYRDTDVDTAKATYAAGSSVKAGDLNNNQTQVLYALQEEQNQTIQTHKIKDGAVTTAKIFDGAVTSAKLATDSVTGIKIADDSIDSEHYVDGSIDTAHIGNAQVTTAKIAADAIDGTKIADDSINSEHYVNGSIDAAHIGNSQVTTDKIADANVTENKIATNAVTQTKIANNAVIVDKIVDAAITTSKLANTSVNSTKLASNAVTTDKITDSNVTTLKIADSNVTLAKLASDLKQTTISDSDTQLPTSGAVVDYVAAQLEPFGGFEAIANELSFPNTQPVSGVAISIADAAGIVVNGSGTSTTGRTVGGTTVTINGINSQFNSSTVASGVRFIVTSTGSGHVYNYHKATLPESDLVNLSGDINDFSERYRVGSSNPTSSLDNGDLFFNTSTGKMLVYNGTNTAWEEVQSIGNFFISTLSPAFDNTTQNFTITNAPTNVQQILLVINGVVQKPNAGTSTPAEGFALDGSTVKLAAAPATGSTYHAVVMGSTVNIGTPSDGTVTAAKLTSGAVEEAKIATGAVTTAKIADQAVTLDKLPHGTSSNNGKFLRANNGADPTFETVNTDLSADTSPQLGGSLDLNSNNITGTGSISVTGNLTLTDADPRIRLIDSDHNSDFSIFGNGGKFTISDDTNTADRFEIASDGTVDVAGNLDVGAGVDVTGNITVTGTVDGIDLQTLNTAVAANTAKDLTALSASNLTSGTVPDARFPATLPAVSGANLTNLPAGAVNNIIINGNMTVHQRWDGSASTTNGWDTTDRFRLEYTGTSANPSQNVQLIPAVQNGENPYSVGLRKSFKITNGNQGSAASGAMIQMAYGALARDLVSSGWDYLSSSSYLTLSYYVKSSVAGTFYGRCYTSHGSGKHFAWSTGALTADTWKRVTVQIPGDSSFSTIATKSTDDTSAFFFYFNAYAGTSNTDSSSPTSGWGAVSGSNQYPDYANADWYTTNGATMEFTGVQLERGSTANDVVLEPYGDTLRKCQQYFFVAASDNYENLGIGFQYYSGTMYTSIPFPVEMIYEPTLIALSGTSGAYMYEKLFGNVAQYHHQIALDAGKTSHSRAMITMSGDASKNGQCVRHSAHWSSSNAHKFVTFQAELS